MNLAKRISIAALLAVMSWCFAPAQNFIYLSGGGGYATYLDDIDFAKPGFGAEGLLGVGYEMQRGHFLLDAGLELNYAYVQNIIGDSAFSFNMIDTEGDPFVYVGKVTDRTDVCRTFNAKIPIMLGGKFGRFYLMAGAKANLNVLGQTRSKADFTTWGEYPQMIDPFMGMPNHGFDNYKLKSDGNINFNFGVSAAAELGFYFGENKNNTGFSIIRKKYPNRYRLALYGEYGLLNLHENKSKGSFLQIDPTQYLQATPLHVYSSDEALDRVINNLSIGVKFTILFQLSEPRKCVICDLKDM